MSGSRLSGNCSKQVVQFLTMSCTAKLSPGHHTLCCARAIHLVIPKFLDGSCSTFQCRGLLESPTCHRKQQAIDHPEVLATILQNGLSTGLSEYDALLLCP